MTFWQTLENKITDLVNKENFMSVEWKIRAANKVVSQGLVHRKNSSNKLEFSDKPIYRIYSMTKPIVSLAALIAVQQKKVGLNEPIKNYLPSFSNIKVKLVSGKFQKLKRPITIVDLLTHNSGLSYGFNDDCHIGQLYKKDKLIHKTALNLGQFVANVAKFPLAFQPGTSWRYSLSIDVLAYLLEIVFVDTIENILEELILKPLKMRDTAYYVPKTDFWRLMPIFGEQDLDLVSKKTSSTKQKTEIDLSTFYSSKQEVYKARGGHGLFSTTADYDKFCQFFINRTSERKDLLLSDKLLNFSIKNQILPQQIPISINGEAREGYGWNLIGRVKKERKKNSDHEFGWAGASGTYFWIDPSLRLTGVIMTQHLGHDFKLGETIQEYCSQVTANHFKQKQNIRSYRTE